MRLFKTTIMVTEYIFPTLVAWYWYNGWPGRAYQHTTKLMIAMVAVTSLSDFCPRGKWQGVNWPVNIPVPMIKEISFWTICWVVDIAIIISHTPLPTISKIYRFEGFAILRDSDKTWVTHTPVDNVVFLLTILEIMKSWRENTPSAIAPSSWTKASYNM